MRSDDASCLNCLCGVLSVFFFFYLEIAALCVSVFICWIGTGLNRLSTICMYITFVEYSRGRKIALVSAHSNFSVLFGNKFLNNNNNTVLLIIIAIISIIILANMHIIAGEACEGL